MSNEGLLRLPQVLELFPVCRSNWLEGVRAGRYPKPIRLSKRTVAWRRSDIAELIEQLGAQTVDEQSPNDQRKRRQRASKLSK